MRSKKKMKFFYITRENKSISLQHFLNASKSEEFKMIIKEFPKENHPKYVTFDIVSCTENCIRILSKNQNISEELLRNEKGGNIYCPLHENQKSSKTPSGKLLAKRNLYICFSSNCPLPKNSRNNKIISTYKLSQILSKTKK